MSFKGAAQGKGKGKSSGVGQGHTLPRTRISAEKFSGTCLQWRGKYGWIQPAEEIPHEKSSLNRGSLFCSMDDVSAGSLEAGAPVQFHIFEDESGLGAEECEQVGPAPPGAAAAAAAKSGGKGKSWQPKGDGKTWQSKGQTPSWGCGAKTEIKGGGKSWITTKCPMVGFKGGMKSDGKAQGKTGNKGKGHTLPRTRISAEKFTGSVLSWKGKYGWIKPGEEIPHEQAAKNNGALFVSMDDVNGKDLTAESQVEFHIFEDSSGLGAEEVVQL